MSLPSPGGASCSLDGPHEGGAMSPPANVSRRRDSTSSEAPALQGRVNVLHRVSRWFDYGKQGFKWRLHLLKWIYLFGLKLKHDPLEKFTIHQRSIW